MTDLLVLAYRHGYGGGDWITHMVVSAIVRSVIFGVVFRAMRHLTFAEGVLLAIVVLVLVYAWGRSRNRGF